MGGKMIQNETVIQRRVTIERKKGRYPILFLQPVLKSMVWGGERLRTDFGYEDCWWLFYTTSDTLRGMPCPVD